MTLATNNTLPTANPAIAAPLSEGPSPPLEPEGEGLAVAVAAELDVDVGTIPGVVVEVGVAVGNAVPNTALARDASCSDGC